METTITMTAREQHRPRVVSQDVVEIAGRLHCGAATA
jgi:hypothetical protein